MEQYETSFGVLAGITAFERYPGGQLKSCIVNRENRLSTRWGEFVPQYREVEPGERSKKHHRSVSLYESGALQSVALERQTLIETPLMPIHAELVTFYENGSVNRVFPLNGKIDGYWTEQNERALAKGYRVSLPFAEFEAKVMAVHFYPGGKLKSLTLWPGERVTLPTPAGEMDVRAGFSLYESGSLRSVEPAKPTEIATPIGTLLAYDCDIVGMHADSNSLQFTESGDVTSITTTRSAVTITDLEGTRTTVQPLQMPGLLDASETRIVPLRIRFEETQVVFRTLEPVAFNRGCHFETAHADIEKPVGGCEHCTDEGECTGACDGCSAC